MPQRKVYIADSLFTGEEWIKDAAVIVTDGRIEEIVESSAVPSGIEEERFDSCFFAPAFIDLQIYGAAGKLFSAYPEPASLSVLVDHCASGGTAFCLPTIATNTLEVFHQCIDATRKYWNEGGKGVLGLHLEGPWISTAKKGAHIESCIHPPTLQEVATLLKYGQGIIKMITLAPEVCSREIIDLILSHHIIISAGHSNATYDQASEAFNGGIPTVTHLFNAMSALQHRAPGFVGAVFNHSSVNASIIPDGYHVDFAALQVAKKIMGGRLFVITDAVTETSIGAYKHYVSGDKYEAAGMLSGSALTMNLAVRNLVKEANIELDEALRMCSLYPARIIGNELESGKIMKGYKSDIVVLDEKLNVKKLITSL